MHVEGDKLIFDENEVEAVIRQIYMDFASDISAFLPRDGGGEKGVELKRIMIPLTGEILGMEVIGGPL